MSPSSSSLLSLVIILLVNYFDFCVRGSSIDIDSYQFEGIDSEILSEEDYNLRLQQKQQEQVFDYADVSQPEPQHGLLYPRESESREIRILDGIWRFLKSNRTDPMQGVREKWFKRSLDTCGPTIPMPVPASYNDITTDASLRDHVGTVWYERNFFVPAIWAQEQRVWLRFGSVNYAAIVWLNGEQILRHQIGHLPFGAEVTHHLYHGGTNRLTVLCDNTLTNITIPQGQVAFMPTDEGSTIMQTYTFDFFHYAGIHRSVHLYTTPAVYIDDVSVGTDLFGNGTGHIHYNISIDGLNTIMFDKDSLGNSLEPLSIHVQVRDKLGKIVGQNRATENENQFKGSIIIPQVNPWYPYLMHKEPGYLYEMELYLHAADNSLLDVYRLKTGVRTLTWTNTTLKLNGVPIYMHGFGRHEDADIRGKGLDYALLTHDFNLLKWIGANAYRTSHYPYSEESMQFADEHGIMIIDECPGVNIDGFDPALLRNHMSAIDQLIHRDRNHPSVIAWSIANEPRSQYKQAELYFGKLANFTRSIAGRRPITASINANVDKDKLAQFLDIISFNRYNAWYQNAGKLDMITNFVIAEAKAWHEKFNKPVLMSEYGADTMEGMHSLPSFIWSEDYQIELFSKHFKAFDELRREGWFIGEFVWNFADFKTEQTFTRVGGNKKGVFTRARQPKSVAHVLRQRYLALAYLINNTPIPADVFPYVIHDIHN